MDVLIKEEFNLRKDDLIDKVKEGKIFIYPTDTIYGIGANANDEEAVQKIRDIKGRPKMPFSIIAPSKSWIKAHCELSIEGEKWLDKLPGPYTLILKQKKDSGLAKGIAPGIETLGVRIPDHWFTDFVKELGFPIITTSANVVGENFMTSLDDFDPGIRQHMDFCVYENTKKGRPSKIIDLTQETRIIKR